MFMTLCRGPVFGTFLTVQKNVINRIEYFLAIFSEYRAKDYKYMRSENIEIFFFQGAAWDWNL